MRKYQKMAGVVVIAMLAAILTRWTAQAAPAPAPAHVTRWEYAQFQGSSAGNVYAFNPPGKQIKGKSLAVLYKAMTGKDPVKHDEGQAVDCIYLDIMNAAGADGWELVKMEEKELGENTFTFKRLVP